MLEKTLKKLTDKQYNYLLRIKTDMKRVLNEDYLESDKEKFTRQSKHIALGYIKALEHCGIISQVEFRVLYTWMTV